MQRQCSRRVLVIVALFGGTGCGGAPSIPGSLPAPARAASARHPDYRYHRRLVFESDDLQKAVNVYAASALAKNPMPIATIDVQRGCPTGLAMDQTGTLYVLDACNGNDIEQYPPGRTTPSVTITNGVNSPIGAAIDGNQTLYVSNTSPASIAEYSYGSTSPSRTISGQGLVDPLGIAVDRNGGLYIADDGAAGVFLVPAGTSNVVPLNLKGVSEPLAVAVEPTTGDLWVGDGASGSVNIYRPGSAIPARTLGGLMYPFAMAIEQDGNRKGTAVVGDVDTDAVWAYHPGRYKPYAELTSGISFPDGLLIATP
ncbi:MAG TPA: hypothetical protein VGX91_11900 [Candidatus Cybelea sp.]|jgi:hypothetical protein|nr:hypothetical protein [Candidatus Cybelea sp.]